MWKYSINLPKIELDSMVTTLPDGRLTATDNPSMAIGRIRDVNSFGEFIIYTSDDRRIAVPNHLVIGQRSMEILNWMWHNEV